MVWTDLEPVNATEPLPSLPPPAVPSYRVVLFFDEVDCDVCLDQETQFIKTLAAEVGDAHTMIVLEAANRRYLASYVRVNGLTHPVYYDSADAFAAVAPKGLFWSLRVVDTVHDGLRVRQDVFEPPAHARSTGAMVTVVDGDGIGYAATPDLSAAGLARAGETARAWARRTAALNLLHGAQYPRPQGQWTHLANDPKPWLSVSLAERIELLHEASRSVKAAAPRLGGDPVLVD